jgi:hypothetical protein
VEPEPPRDVHRPVQKLNWTTIALIGGLVVLVLIIAYFATDRNADQDKLIGGKVTTSVAVSDSEKKCSSPQTYDLIKRQLFARAAQLRGSDQAAFDKLSGYAVIRLEHAVMESEDSATRVANCSASLSLDLPPGVTVAGGRRTLMSDIDYSVQSATGGATTVVLRNADAIAAPLATLTQGAQPPQPAVPIDENAVAPEVTDELAPSVTPPAAAVRPIGTRPSFDCARANSKSEIAVCSDAGLATLDRNMAAQYSRAAARASPVQLAELRRTRERFIAYRDRCPDRTCIGDAYVGRMREIRDIMEGRWQPPR